MEIMNASNFIFFCSSVIAFAITVLWVYVARRLCRNMGQVCDEPFNLIQPVKLPKDKTPWSNSGWSGPLITIGGILGTALSLNRNQAFADFSILFAIIFLVASLLDSAISKLPRKADKKVASKSKRLQRMGQFAAGGLALWSVIGQIWATWYLLGVLTLTPLLIGASRLFLVMAVVLVVVYDVLRFVTTQGAHLGQQVDQSHKQSSAVYERQHSMNLVPLPTRNDGEVRMDVEVLSSMTGE